MGNAFERKQSLTCMLFGFLLFMAILSSCGSTFGGQSSPGNQTAVIDWVNFVRFGGITYLAASTKPGRELKDSDLGPVFATVKFKLDGNEHDPAYKARDGDAAYLDAGTQVFTVKSYKPIFRLAARLDNQMQLYEADTNPLAHKGVDLLDIGGRVIYIGINSPQDGVTQLGAIKDPHEVTALVNMVLQAQVNQKYVSQGSVQYFITFYLVDGTSVTRAYWLNSGELARGILLPKTFGTAVVQAVVK